MTVKELITLLNTELSEEEKNLPICFDDSEWGAFDCEIKSYSIQIAKYRKDKTEAVVLEDE
jgi:hypothetical protein